MVMILKLDIPMHKDGLRKNLKVQVSNSHKRVRTQLAGQLWDKSMLVTMSEWVISTLIHLKLVDSKIITLILLVNMLMVWLALLPIKETMEMLDTMTHRSMEPIFVLIDNLMMKAINLETAEFIGKLLYAPSILFLPNK